MLTNPFKISLQHVVEIFFYVFTISICSLAFDNINMPQQFMYIWLYKPFNVLCQFSPEGDKTTLAAVLKDIPKDVYPVGRLDYDSEGLLLLTNDKSLTHQLLDPKYTHERTYFVQVEGAITEEAISKLCTGVDISINGKKHRTQPAKARIIDTPPLPERHPPIRFRAYIPTTWLALTLTEGKNRQVRRMTAAVGFPTLRLVRYSIGLYTIAGLDAGSYIKEFRIDKNQLLIKSTINSPNKFGKNSR